MKRKIIILAMLAMAVSAGAQMWERTVEPGNELKGTQEMAKYRIEDAEKKQVMAFCQPGDYWKVGIGGRVFQPNKSGNVVKKTLNFVTYATIGYYDENDKLTAKHEKCLLQLTQGMQVAEVTENIWGKTTKGAKDVVPYLMNKRGYVRIIIETVRGPEFDMKVPCVNNP